jgi:GntR family transcriptional regulator, transcriptional repressor for pyruvate dehydrogenase complex
VPLPSHAPFSRLSSASRSDQVRDQLESAIRRGEYAPGDRLPSERELTEMLGVSRVSVREGIRSLEAIGLLEVRHGNGCFVLDPARRTGRELGRWLDLHRGEVIELLLVRAPLDELAAGLAADRQDTDALAAVHAAHEAFIEEVQREEGPNVDKLSDLDIAFHVAIARAGGSDLLYDLLDDLHKHLRESRKAGFEPEGSPARAAREHVAIVDAIDRGDTRAARRAVSKHVARVRRLLESS